MTRKPRFGNFVTTPPPMPESSAESAPISSPVTSDPVPVPPPVDIPAAPIREERRAFSTRVRPSQKAMLEAYIMELKSKGWPVSQEGVLEELLRLLAEDAEVRARITARLTQR